MSHYYNREHSVEFFLLRNVMRKKMLIKKNAIRLCGVASITYLLFGCMETINSTSNRQIRSYDKLT